MSNSLFNVRAYADNPNWEKMVAREQELYSSDGDIRSPFARDYTRILHSTAFRRLKHKTQVFFNIDNDHICTRMEHVGHVESVSYTIANQLGLNLELTKAIAFGHDLGHAPFGHRGEEVLTEIIQKNLGSAYSFWHEKNGLRFVDDLELLPNHSNELINLDLTYAVRDGIISHCGELDSKALFPREQYIDLKNDFTIKGQFQPYTWEGCVVKFADKIAYVGRDIEDAKLLGFISSDANDKLIKLAQKFVTNAINTTVIMHYLIIDACKNSSLDNGISLSKEGFEILSEVTDFNNEFIYRNERLNAFKDYAKHVLNSIFDTLLSTYESEGKFWTKISRMKKYYPTLMDSFGVWLTKYVNREIIDDSFAKSLSEDTTNCKNIKVYGSLNSKKIYIQAIIDFMSGMTDRFAVKMHEELIHY